MVIEIVTIISVVNKWFIFSKVYIKNFKYHENWIKIEDMLSQPLPLV